MKTNVTKEVFNFLISGEYFASLEQSYTITLCYLSALLGQLPKEQRKNAIVVLDIDETILSSVCDTHLAPFSDKYIGDLIVEYCGNKNLPYKPEAYSPDSNMYLPLPGAVEFVAEVNRLVEGSVIFVTGRGASAADITVRNLHHHGIDFRELYMNPSPHHIAVGLFKNKIREQLNGDNTIVLCMGDKPTDLGLQAYMNFLVKNPFY